MNTTIATAGGATRITRTLAAAAAAGVLAVGLAACQTPSKTAQEDVSSGSSQSVVADIDPRPLMRVQRHGQAALTADRIARESGEAVGSASADSAPIPPADRWDHNQSR